VGDKKEDRDEFTVRYGALIRHYGMESEHTQPVSPNENGDIEQSHNRFLIRMEQALMQLGMLHPARMHRYAGVGTLPAVASTRNSC
jgi:hypothetical protein